MVAWGNGTAVTGGAAYRHFLEHSASWGIVTIASHSGSAHDGSFHIAAIDYLLAQNSNDESEFFNKLSNRTGVSGHSSGGAGANTATSHPNVEAIVNVQGSSGSAPAKGAFLCLTGTEDLNPQGCKVAVNAVASLPALFASYNGIDHIEPVLATHPGKIQYVRLFTAWFRCFLADDSRACAIFQGGADCPVCQESVWAEIFARNY